MRAKYAGSMAGQVLLQDVCLVGMLAEDGVSDGIDLPFLDQNHGLQRVPERLQWRCSCPKAVVSSVDEYVLSQGVGQVAGGVTGLRLL